MIEAKAMARGWRGAFGRIGSKLGDDARVMVLVEIPVHLYKHDRPDIEVAAAQRGLDVRHLVSQIIQAWLADWRAAQREGAN